MKDTNLNKLAMEIHKTNVEKGFWDNPREIGTLLMLVVSELSEALEADRKGFYPTFTGDKFYEYVKFKYQQFNADSTAVVNEKDVFVQCFKEHIKDTFADEIADAIIRLLDLAASLGIDLDFHIQAKDEFNSAREFMHAKRY